MNLFKNRTVLGILCITLSLLICFVITPLFNKEMAQKTEIVRVTQPIFTGQTITSDMVTVTEVGGYNLPETVMKTQDMVVGNYALADFAAGDYILQEKISDTLQAENAYLYTLDGSQQAISLTIPALANGLSGKLQSGDIISVIAPNFRGTGFTVIPPELKYVEVISVTTKSGEDANLQTTEEREDESASLPSTVTLLVNELQSQMIAELEAESEIHMALVFRGEREDCLPFLEAQDLYFLQMEEQEGFYFDETLGEWVEIPEGYYWDKNTSTLMGIPEGFYYSAEMEMLVPITEEDSQDVVVEPEEALPNQSEPENSEESSDENGENQEESEENREETEEVP